MKTKIFLGILCCVLLVSLIGLVISTRVQAQASVPSGSWMEERERVILVKYAEDPMRQHGRQVQSYHILSSQQYTPVDTVPSDKRFILTDIMRDAGTSVHFRVGETGQVKAIWGGSDPHVAQTSGTVFEPGETIEVYTLVDTRVTISGYYVDML